MEAASCSFAVTGIGRHNFLIWAHSITQLVKPVPVANTF